MCCRGWCPQFNIIQLLQMGWHVAVVSFVIKKNIFYLKFGPFLYTLERSPVRDQEETQTQPQPSQVGVLLLVLVPTPERWERWLGSGMWHQICAKSNTWLHQLWETRESPKPFHFIALLQATNTKCFPHTA